MATKVSISSNALLMLGARPINDLTEDDDRAQLAANLYDQVRDALLRSHPWNCSTKRVILAPTTTAPAFDYAYAFNLPADWLKTLQVGESHDPLDYVTESGQILCDYDAVPLRYVWRNDNEATWDAMVVHGMTLAMQAHMAYAITKSASMRDSARQEMIDFLRQARSADGMDDPPETLGDFPLLMSRF